MQRAAELLVSAVAKFEAAVAKGVRPGGRAAGIALAKLAAAAPPGDPSLQATLEVKAVESLSDGVVVVMCRSQLRPCVWCGTRATA